MRKFLLALGVAASTILSAAAVPSVAPSPGAINMEIYSGGIGSITIKVTGSINRECTGYATLAYEGKIIKSIPASNERWVYCTEGFDKVSEGNPFVGFYSGADSPATKPGRYTVTIPSDFYRVNGVGNSPFTLNYSIGGVAYDMIFSPEFNSSVGSLPQIKITFEGCTNLKYKAKTASGPQGGTGAVTKTGVYLETDAGDIEVTPVIEGNTAIINVPDKANVKGSLALNALDGVFTFTNSKGASGSNSKIYGRYNITGSSSSIGTTPEGYTLTNKEGELAGGVYDKIEAYEQIKNENESYGQIYYTYTNRFFDLNLPDGLKTHRVMMSRPQFYKEDLTTKAGSTFTLVQKADKSGFYVTTSGENDNVMPLENGTFFLVVPAGAFYYIPADGAGASSSPKLTFGPFVIMDMATTGFYLTPDPDKVQSELSQITITFDEGSTVEWKATEWGQLNYGTIEYDFRATAKDNQLFINLPTKFTVEGEWTLEIPSTALNVNDKPMGISAVYTINRDYISNIEITNNGNPTKCKLIADDEEYGVPYWSAQLQTAADKNTADFTFILPEKYDAVYYRLENQTGGGPLGAAYPVEDLIKDGGYTLAANHTVTGLPIGVTPLSFTFAKDGVAAEPSLMIANVSQATDVKGIEAEEGEAEYFNLQGVKIEKPESGIVIKVVNGKATKVTL